MACSICRCRACPAVTNSSTPEPRSPPCGNASPIWPMRPIEAGVANASWPGRLQNLSRGRLAALAPRGAEIWLDGGHNEAGGRVLAEAMADFEEKTPRPLVLLYGCLQTKDAAGFPAPFHRSGQRGRGPARLRRASRPRARRDCGVGPRSRASRRAPPQGRGGFAGSSAAGLGGPAAHTDRRLALSGRRSSDGGRLRPNEPPGVRKWAKNRHLRQRRPTHAMLAPDQQTDAAQGGENRRNPRAALHRGRRAGDDRHLYPLCDAWPDRHGLRADAGRRHQAPPQEHAETPAAASGRRTRRRRHRLRLCRALPQAAGLSLLRQTLDLCA